MERDNQINIKQYSIFLNKKIKNPGLPVYYLAFDNNKQINYMCKIIPQRELHDKDKYLDDLKRYKGESQNVPIY